MKQSQDDDVKRLASLISDIKVAMMTTVEDDGSLRSRPMMTQSGPFEGSLWFFTREDSAKVHELEHDWHVALTYADSDADKYVSISGAGRLVRDRQKAEQLWNPLYRAWFPKGLDDPELALVEVVVRKAEYWDKLSRKMITLEGFTSAPMRQPAQSSTVPTSIH